MPSGRWFQVPLLWINQARRSFVPASKSLLTKLWDETIEPLNVQIMYLIRLCCVRHDVFSLLCYAVVEALIYLLFVYLMTGRHKKNLLTHPKRNHHQAQEGKVEHLHWSDLYSWCKSRQVEVKSNNRYGVLPCDLQPLKMQWPCRENEWGHCRDAPQLVGRMVKANTVWGMKRIRHR